MEPQADADKGILTFVQENTPLGPGVRKVHAHCIVCGMFGNYCVTKKSEANRRLRFYALSSIQLVV